MKKRNLFAKLISFILCITILSPTVVQATSIGNTDTISGHWAEETLTYWDMLGLFDEIPNEEFGIDKSITRGAFVYIFNTMLSIQQPENTKNIFTDITESDWNYDDIVTSYSIGYISGYPDNTFRADSLITREEMCTVISRYFGLDKVYNENKLQSFTDKEKIQSYALDHIGALAELETVNGYPNGSFKPQNNITYAETVTIITRFLSYINGGSGISGRVYYEDKPVYNATISIFENGTNSIVAESTSDPYGDYIIDVPAGTYDITFTKDGTVYMLADVEVTGDIRTYNKIELETGEYVTGTIVDENGKPIAGKTLYIQGDSCIDVETDENGVFSVIIPQNKNYTLSADIDGTVWQLVAFETQSFEDGVDLGKITLTTGEIIKAEQEKITPPYWFLDQYIQNMTNKDDDKDDKKDENNNEDIYPDYSYLPYREPKTIEELVKLNGGEQPEIVVDENGKLSLYMGKVSVNVVESVEDVITEINNLSLLMNLSDSRVEFIPVDTGKQYDRKFKLQQVYEGVQVYDAQVSVVTDDDGYITSVLSHYYDEIKFSNISTTPSFDKNTAIEKLIEHFGKEYEQIDVYSIDLCILPEQPVLVYHVNLSCDMMIYLVDIDANNGEFWEVEKIEPLSLDYTTDNSIKSKTVAFDGKNINISTYQKNGKTIQQLYNISKKINIFDMDNKYSDDKKKDNYILKAKEEELFKIVDEESNNWGESSRAYCDGLNAIFYLDEITDIWDKNTEFKLSEVNLPISVLVNSKKYNNAAYWPVSTAIAFIIGSAYNYIDYRDVVGHEFGHFIQDYYVNPLNSSKGLGNGTISRGYDDTSWDAKQATAISEGTADIFGMLYEAIVNRTNIHSDEDFYVIGDDLYGKGKDVRNHNAKNSSKTCKNIDTYRKAYDWDNTLSAYRGSYILVEILRYMIENDETVTAEQLLEFWRRTIANLDTSSTFSKLYNAMLSAADSSTDFKPKKELIKSACNHIGIIQIQNKQAKKWYAESFEYFTKTGIIDNFIEDDGTYILGNNITQKEFIQLVVDFCNTTTESKLKVSYTENTATFSINSSDQSMSLMFDESKDILRWEAYIITDRILNFYHYVIAEYKDVSVQYNYPYLDTTTKNKNGNYATFIELLERSENTVKNGLPDVSANDVLKKYYNGMSYTQFHEQYMYTKNQNGTANYDFSNDSYQFMDGQRVVLDSMYNIYMSLGKKITPVTKSHSSQFNVCEPMTLATACYLLYAYIQK